MAPFINEAAWITSAKASPFEVGPGPAPNPSENEVVIKVAYAAVNPIDWKFQDHPFFEPEYPYILGTDVAGTIVQLGSKVTRFELGQRVIGHCDALMTAKNANAGFQLYNTCRENLVAAIPDSLPLVNAAVLPVSVSCAASALFVQLGVPLPSLTPTLTGKRILVWGGSSSVGSSAIQLAIAAGFEVVATAGSANHDLVRSLGASHIFDHKDEDVINKVLNILKPGDLVVDCISKEDSLLKCAEILEKIGGGKLPLMDFASVSFPENVETPFVNSLDPGLVNLDVGDAIWRKYLPEALAAGKFQAKPDPFVIPGGLEKVQEGVDLLRKGVSGKKIVIELSKE